MADGAPSDDSRNKRAVNKNFKKRRNHKEAAERADKIQLRHQQKIEENPRVANKLRKELRYTKQLYSERIKQEERAQKKSHTPRHEASEHRTENTDKSNSIPNQYLSNPRQQQTLYKRLQSQLSSE